MTFTGLPLAAADRGWVSVRLVAGCSWHLGLLRQALLGDPWLPQPVLKLFCELFSCLANHCLQLSVTLATLSQMAQHESTRGV